MKHALLAATLLPFASPLSADIIPINAPVTAATLYSEGATVTRTVPFTAPEGAHELLITNLPENLDPTSVRVALDGATLGAITVRNNRTFPLDLPDSPALTVAKAARDVARDALRAVEDSKADALLTANAAKARLAFLATLKAPTETAASAETLLATLTLINEQTLAIQKEIATIERDTRRFEQTLKGRQQDLQDAQKLVDALTPTLNENAMLSISITTQEATTGALTLTHLTDDAGWEPVYDLHLTTGDTPTLTLKRGAFIGQYTGEDWRDVAVTLSTSRPDAQTQPQTLWPNLRRILPQQEQLAYATDSRALKSAPAPMAEMAIMADTAAVDFGDGVNATYNYNTPVDLTSDADVLRIALDTLALTPTVYAHANPLYDETAFLMADVTNASEEIILPSENSSFYLNGTFIGASQMPLLAQGDKTDLSFGPINGLRLTETLVQRNTGDSGVITTRNDQTEERILTAENLTGQTWDLRLFGRVPYSEQEDLQITWQAAPAPTSEDVHGARGILMWERPLAAKETFTVTLSHELKWPTDMILR
ncbi:DUF4139 domain-containing protein [Shimia sp. MMG029]|uniref:DUF4139 domain-containing protein n=1 Tax=Shimia sp. MMG029 TaxID=3021978 RepID=UPI0022FE5D15|nr:DUF4139 domain-containing protein [Shimia sp. MMG029]MDA5557304.1 DUF4139 domain-containing protein [Shimia sp. MMG029]